MWLNDSFVSHTGQIQAYDFWWRKCKDIDQWLTGGYKKHQHKRQAVLLVIDDDDDDDEEEEDTLKFKWLTNNNSNGDWFIQSTHVR